MACDACTRGPRDFAGHAGLGVLVPEKQPREGMAFACLACGTCWLRRHEGNGAFRWSRTPRPAL